MLCISSVTILHQKKEKMLGWSKRTIEGQECGGGRVKELRLLTQQNKVSGEIQFLSGNVKAATSGLERAI